MEALPNTTQEIETPRVIPRTEAEWQKLLDVRRAEAKKMQADARAARKQGKKELAKDYTKKAKYWQDHFISPLENNVELARHAPSGTHADSYYDASQWTLARMLGKTDAAPSRIMSVGGRSAPPQSADTVVGRNEAANPPPPTTAENSDNTTNDAITNNSTTAPVVRTIEKESTNEKFTKFSVDEVPEVTDLKAKIELMEQSLRCVIEAFFAGDLPGVETFFHEFQHDLYRATKRNSSLMTEVKASILMRLQMREPVETQEPDSDVKQEELPMDFGESEKAA